MPRLFYCAKTTTADRNEGVTVAKALSTKYNHDRLTDTDRKFGASSPPKRNNHPTVKPTKLMQWLCRLIAPPGGHVLDPFAGSG